jgi:hypothetical protein
MPRLFKVQTMDTTQVMGTDNTNGITTDAVRGGSLRKNFIEVSRRKRVDHVSLKNAHRVRPRRLMRCFT